MRAVTYDKQLSFSAAYPNPTPGDGERLVRVRLAGICATDLQILGGYMGFTGVLGHEMVGIVEGGSSNWNGKRVVSEINCVCRKCDMCQSGLSRHCPNRTVLGIDRRDGCFADYLVVPEQNLHEVPPSISDEEAVFIEPLAAACQVLAQCPIDKRMTVSVVGTGRLGLLVAQVLSETGCRLTAVGRNRKKLSLCDKKGIQAMHVDELIARNDRDVVVDCSGSASGLELAMAMVRPRGRIVLKSTYAETGPLNLAPIVVNEIQLIGSRCGPFGEAINALTREAVEVRSMISRTFPIENAMEAFEACRVADNIKILLRMGTR